MLSHFRWSSGKFPNAQEADLSLLLERVVHVHLAGVCFHTQATPDPFRASEHRGKPRWVKCSPQHEVVAMVPSPLGFSTMDFHPSLMDRKLSPKLQVFQPVDTPSRADHKDFLSGFTTGCSENSPLVWSTSQQSCGAGVLTSSPMLSHRRFRLGHRLTSLLKQRRDMFVSDQKKSTWGNQHCIHLTYKQLWISTQACGVCQFGTQKYNTRFPRSPSRLEEAQAHRGGK